MIQEEVIYKHSNYASTEFNRRTREDSLLNKVKYQVNSLKVQEEDLDVVNVVATEMIQTEYSDKPRYVAYTTVGDEPEAFAFDAISYDSDLEREARRRAMSTDQVEDLRMAWLKLENARKNKEAHEAKLAEVKANYELSDFEMFLKKELLQLFVNNVGKPYCERTYRDSWSHGKDHYGVQTFNDIIAYITTQWKSSDWGNENYLDQIVIREVYETVR
jgi:hypothetical protein